MCLRWLRAQGHEQRFSIPNEAHAGDEDEPADALAQLPAADGDLSLQLERHELADLLGQALALLPAEAREALVATYLDELPQQELAARLGLREGALRARLHRGKQMLRRVLEDDLRTDALDCGLLPVDEVAWQVTRIFCPFCGIHHLACHLDRATGAFFLRCVGECQPGIGGIVGGEQPPTAAHLTSLKALVSRQCLELGEIYRGMVAGMPRPCPRCGAPVRIGPRQPDDDIPAPILAHGVVVSCPRCGLIDGASHWHLALDTPEAVAFWRRHPRIRALPIQTLEFSGEPAIQTGFESSADHARLEIITARDSLRVLRTSDER